MANSESRAEDIFARDGKLRFDLVTEVAAEALREAARLARETRWESIRSPHIFMGLLAVPDAAVCKWGERLKADLAKLLSEFQELFQQEGDLEGSPALNREFLSDNVIRILRDAHQRARDHDRPRVSSMDLLITLLTASNSIVAECFERIGVTAAKLTEIAVIAEKQSET